MREPPNPRQNPGAPSDVSGKLLNQDTDPDLRSEHAFDPEKLQVMELPDGMRSKLVAARVAMARKDPTLRHRIAFALTGKEEKREEVDAPAAPAGAAASSPHAIPAATIPATTAPKSMRHYIVSASTARALVVGVLLGGVVMLIVSLLARKETPPAPDRALPGSSIPPRASSPPVNATAQPPEGEGVPPEERPGAAPAEANDRTSSAPQSATKPSQPRTSGAVKAAPRPNPVPGVSNAAAGSASPSPASGGRRSILDGRFAPNHD